MGAGIAKAFREKYPDNYRVYGNYCKTKVLRTGHVLVHEEGDRYIFNIASQDKPGAHARYDWLFDAGLKSAERAYNLGHKVIAIPQIGCGIGGLEWEHVETILRAIEILTPGFEWEVWQL
jgi:O-acetyl-ADP-ribose deacetylase (regulator of RNase III)